MKDLYYLFTILFVTSLHAQSLHTVDFEVSGVGNDWSWTDDEGGTSSLVDNPSVTGINTSAKVISLTKTADSNDWALTYTDDNETFTFDADNDEVKVKVYKPFTSNFCIKFEGSSTPKEVCVANTQTNTWEELTFDFSGVIGNSYNKIVIIPDNFDSGAGVHYFDDLIVPDGVVTVVPELTTNAPTPTVDALNVISIYSDTYTDIAGTDFNPNWGQSTAVNTAYDPTGEETNTVIEYSNLNFQGTQFPTTDVSGMINVHFDVWTPFEASIQFTPISPGQENLVSVTSTGGTWTSIDLDLASNFSNVVLSEIFQLKFNGGNGGTVYLDNIYFSSTVLSNEKRLLQEFSVYPNPVRDVVNISAGESIQRVRVYDLTGRMVKQANPNTSDFSLDVADLSKGVYFVKLNAGDREATTKLIK